MFTYIIKFFTDPETFTAALAPLRAFVSSHASMIRGFLMAFAFGIITGEGPFAPLTTALGGYGMAGASALAILSVMVKAGNITPPSAMALEHANPDQLQELLKRIGVPADVAKDAAAGKAIAAPDKK